MSNAALQEESPQTQPLQTIGGRLKALRLETGLTQSRLAIQSGTTAMHIMDMENGYNDFEGKLDTIANALGCEPQWLQTGKGKAKIGDPEPA